MHADQQEISLGLHQMVWIEDGELRRNQVVRFERRFALEHKPAACPLALFADTRYRLRVNGVFIATGPARFVTSHPEYDSHDLAPYLVTGENCIAVEVNFYGTSSYQTMPDGRPGFAAAGGTAEVDLATPGAWRAFRTTAWREDAPKFSFAQGPVEICDTRKLDEAIPAPLIPCTGNRAPWGPLTPYQGPAIPFVPHRPRGLELAGALATHERRIGFMASGPDPQGTDQGTRPWTAFATWIHAPAAETITLSAFWSDITLNGHPVPVDTNSPLGNHGRVELPLLAGWNLLVGALEVLTEFWPYCLGIPETTRATFHARQDRHCRDPWAIAPVGPREGLALPAPGARKPPAGWTAHDGNTAPLTPARMMSWDAPAPGALRKLDPARLDEAGTIEDRAATWCFSFAGEFVGHIIADVEGPAGAILDVACDDWQREDGGVALYHSNPFTDAADRYVLRGGRQVIEGFHVRGGKLIQLTLRVSDGAPPARLSLRDLWVRSRQTLGPDQTRLVCDQLPEAQWAWPVALRTLRVSTEDAYTDCPWRERASYIGDTLVALHLHALYDPDLRVAARVLRLFGQAQLPNGQLACCAPSWLRKPHEDFTLLWLIALDHYVQFTGDLDLIRDQWPTVERIWSSPSWDRHDAGLWNANHHRMFIDWGVRPEEREGDANAVMNILRVAAGRSCARLARLTGRDHAAWLDDAETTRRAIFAHLWHGPENRLRAFAGGTTPALHANILALAFELGDARQRAAMLAHVEPMLADNLTRGLRMGRFSGHLELFYLFFALPALARHGRPDLAEQVIRKHYGHLMKAGDDTLPECFCSIHKAGGSRCHTWSGAAAVYAARYILGLRPADTLEFGHLTLDPVVHAITRASGRIAHARGWIDVSWERKADGTFHAEIDAPAGITIHPAPAVRIRARV